LLGAIPRVDKVEKEPLVPIKGNPPLLIDLPDACPFADRCPIAIDACRTREPDLVEVRPGTSAPHKVACIRAHEIEDGGRIGGLPVYPVREVPESALTLTPRSERPVTLDVRNLNKAFPLMKGA